MAKKKKKAPTKVSPSTGATVSDFEEIAAGILTPGVSTGAGAGRPVNEFEEIAAGILTPGAQVAAAPVTPVEEDFAAQFEAAAKEATAAEQSAKTFESAANQARILSGQKVQIQEQPQAGLTAEDVQKMLADFYGTIQKDALAEKREAAQSAYSLLYDEFSRYGLGALVLPLQKYIQDGIPKAEFTIRLRNEPAYKRRFAANEQRIAQGLRALPESTYIELEDGYQDVMRRYGMPDYYYKTEKDPVTGVTLQPGFEKFIAGDVSVPELEDRIQTAYNRVIKANPEVMNSLKTFYGDTISNGDILAYALDTKNAIENIKRKVTAAEIGAGAQLAGLGTTRARAEELGAFGVTGAAAREKFQAVAEVLPRGSQLAEIYKQTPYTQTTAEQEVFGLGGAVEAGRQRRKLTELEQASFAGQSGMAGGALARDRAGAF